METISGCRFDYWKNELENGRGFLVWHEFVEVRLGLLCFFDKISMFPMLD
jgi:hypothetical protein